MSENDKCQLCNTKENAASNMASQALLVNSFTDPKTRKVCGHKFCQQCVKRKLDVNRKRSFTCPACKLDVRRNTLSEKSLDELECEKDFSKRRDIKETYNKTLEDFASLLDFQNYEEEVEDIIFTLVHGSDVEIKETEKKVEAYRKENARIIEARNTDSLDARRNELAEIAEIQSADQALQHAAVRERVERRSKDLVAKALQKRQMIGVDQSKPEDIEHQTSALISKFLATNMPGAAGADEAAAATKGLGGDGLPTGEAPLVGGAPNLVFSFLQQRELPKFSFVKQKQRQLTPEEGRLAREVGGYRQEEVAQRDMQILARTFADVCT